MAALRSFVAARGREGRLVLLGMLAAQQSVFYMSIAETRPVNERFEYGWQLNRALAGIDARGFIIGAALAYRLGCGFIPVRKAGKLPFDTMCESYSLEYGEATVEVHTDAAAAGDHVLVIDDLIATGGTILAAAKLMHRLGARIVEAAAVIDLPALGGSGRLQAAGVPGFALLKY